MVLNKRLPGITARDVLPIVRSGDYSSAYGPTDLTRVETFPGAACLTSFAVMQRAETNIVGSLGAIQSGSPPGRDSHLSRICSFALCVFA
jgi:hypothetical protein